MSPFVDQLLAGVQQPVLRVGGDSITLASMLTGAIVMTVAFVVAGIVGRGVAQALARREVAHGATFALVKLTRYVVLMVGAAMALSSVGIHLDALLAASTVILVGIGLGLQDIARNFVSGLILLIERPVARGDFVKIGDALGLVTDIGMRATRVVTRDEVTIIVPNSELISKQVINHSVPTNNLRIWVHVGVAYGTDTALVKQVLLAVAADDEDVLNDPPPEVRFEAFGESTLEFSLLAWIDHPRDDMRRASALRFAIDAAFRKAGIRVPFPQRDLHLHVADSAAPELQSAVHATGNGAFRTGRDGTDG
jgi:small-conductance mechanosensitive channel